MAMFGHRSQLIYRLLRDRRRSDAQEERDKARRAARFQQGAMTARRSILKKMTR
jgi:hypothetical protein